MRNLRTIEGSVVGRLVALDLAHGKPLQGQLISDVTRQVLGRGTEGQYGQGEALRLERRVDLVGRLHVRVDVLRVLEVLEHLDELVDRLCDRDVGDGVRHVRDETDVRVLLVDRDAGSLDRVAHGDEVVGLGLDGEPAVLDENVDYMGYGYLEKPEDLVPPVGIVFWSFRLMIGFGMLVTLVLLLATWFAWKDKIAGKRWLLWAALCCIPLVYIAGQCGWIVAEVGRQPWTIQGLLPVNVAISSLSAAAVKTTFFVFLAVFALFLVIEIRIMLGAIRKGPEVEPENA